MALRNILTKEDQTLYKKCRPVTEFNARLHQLLDDMADTLIESNGVGLAAPQVGILRRFCVVDVGDGLIELINPVITEKSGSQVGSEGCLSIPDRYEEVTRPMTVTVRAQNRKGENITITAEGFKARAFCHEIDHLDGVLYIDRVDKK